MIESWLEFCAATIMAFAVSSDRRETSDTRLGEVFLALPLADGSRQLTPRLSLLTLSIWTPSSYSRK